MATRSVQRDNDSWISDLQAAGPAQQAALADLRSVLLRNLRSALSGYSRANAAFLEDAVQDSLLRILDRTWQFEGRSRFITWATSVAIRVALSELRRRHWKDVSLEDVVASALDFGAGAGDHDIPEPTRQMDRRAIVAKMFEVIRTELTEKQRTALLAELKGVPQAEIGRRLGSNRNAVYKLTHDARKRLKRGLQAAGYRAGDIQTAFPG